LLAQLASLVQAVPMPQFEVHEQAPLVQVDPPAHTVPQAPQLLGSVCSLTQAPLHNDCPAGQEEAQMPAAQRPLVHWSFPVHVVPLGCWTTQV
jgi:hypothetical protein